MNRSSKLCETITAYIRKHFPNNELEGIRLDLFGGSIYDCIRFLHSQNHTH